MSLDGQSILQSETASITNVSNNMGAELEGIALALRVLSQRTELKAMILTDCQSAVLAARGAIPWTDQCFWVVVRDIRTMVGNLRDKGRTIIFQWIPGHCGHPLNETADSLALAAATRQAFTSEVTQLVPLSVLYGFTSARLAAWVAQEWWLHYTRDLGRGKRALRFQAIFRERAAILSLSEHLHPKTRSALLRIRLGNASTNKHQFLFRARDNPWCDHCVGTTDDEWHRIIDCPAYIDERRALTESLASIGCSLSPDVLMNLTGVASRQRPHVMDAFSQFLVNTRLRELFVRSRSTAPPPL